MQMTLEQQTQVQGYEVLFVYAIPDFKEKCLATGKVSGKVNSDSKFGCTPGR